MPTHNGSREGEARPANALPGGWVGRVASVGSISITSAFCPMILKYAGEPGARDSSGGIIPPCFSACFLPSPGTLRRRRPDATTGSGSNHATMDANGWFGR